MEIGLTFNGKTFDICDFDYTLKTAIILSLFTDKRASKDDVF